jgi:hypothetical protein
MVVVPSWASTNVPSDRRQVAPIVRGAVAERPSIFSAHAETLAAFSSVVVFLGVESTHHAVDLMSSARRGVDGRRSVVRLRSYRP